MNQKHYWQQYIAEFIGTFFLIFLGCGSIVIFELSPDSMEAFTIPLIFGATITIMIYANGHISGAHFNPAVTIAFWMVKKFPSYRLPGYLLAQVCGAVSASYLHKLFWGARHSFGVTTFAVDFGVGAFYEFILSFALMYVIISVATDSRALGNMAGLAIGLTVTICSMVGGPLTGAALNPARSLGPAIASGNLSHIWVYWIFPVLGTISAAFLYEKIRCDVPKSDSEDPGCC